MYPNVVRSLLKPWTTAAHALFSIFSQTFTAERRALQWQENEFCLHLHLQSGKWRIEIHVKKETCGVPQKKNKSCSYAASLRLRSRWNHSTDRCRIFRRGFRISFPIFFDQLITWEPNKQSWPKRQFKLKWKRQWKKTAFFTGQSQSFSFFARPSHCCEMQTQLPQNEAPKQTTSSLDRSGHELSREPFIRAVRV